MFAIGLQYTNEHWKSQNSIIAHSSYLYLLSDSLLVVHASHQDIINCRITPVEYMMTW